MEPEEFARWRAEMGYTKRKAAVELGVSPLTVALYEQGFRHDDGRPVTIPKSIDLACWALRVQKNGLVSSTSDREQTEPAIQEEQAVERLNWKDVPKPLLTAAYRKLKERGVKLSSHPFPATVDWLGAAGRGLRQWLSETGVEGELSIYVFPEADAPGGGVAILDFANPRDATAFKMRWW